MVQQGLAGNKVFPFYLVCDVSRSMWDPKYSDGAPRVPLDIVEESVPDLVAALEDDPTAADTAHLCVIAFGDDPVLVLPLSSVDDITSIPSMPRQVSTDFAKVFDFLARRIKQDMQEIARRRWSSYRPAVYFITDGNPQVSGKPQLDETWIPLRERLAFELGPDSPTIVALGIGGIDESTVRRIRSVNPMGIACAADTGAAPGDLLRSIIKSILNSIGNSSSVGELVFSVPPRMRDLG